MSLCIIQEREEYEDEIERERRVREGLEREKRELRSEVEKLQREREGDNVKYQRQISSLQTERAKLEDEKLQLEGEKMQHVEKVSSGVGTRVSIDKYLYKPHRSGIASSRRWRG